MKSPRARTTFPPRGTGLAVGTDRRAVSAGAFPVLASGIFESPARWGPERAGGQTAPRAINVKKLFLSTFPFINPARATKMAGGQAGAAALALATAAFKPDENAISFNSNAFELNSNAFEFDENTFSTVENTFSTVENALVNVENAFVIV